MKHQIETSTVHAGEENRIHGAVIQPIFQTAMYEQGNESNYHDIRYIRLNNSPNHVTISQKIAKLENAESGLVTSSGMAAISTALLTLLKSGDHLIVQDCLYGGTHDLLTKDFPDYNIQFSKIDPLQPSSWELSLKTNTRLIYVETISNPLLQVPMLLDLIKFAKAHKLISIIDNTFASPINFNPITLGFDLVVHSATKYLNGHSDLVAGAIVGKKDRIDTIRHRLNHFGGSLDPHACFLLNRGIKTLSLRVEKQNCNALSLAQMLNEHPKVSRVFYPGLPSHPNYSTAKELFRGFGGMLSFELKSGQAGSLKLLESVKIPISAPSLGGVESLITIPARTSHLGLSPEERRKAGISDSLIRFSTGIESIEDLKMDLLVALEQT